MTTSGG